MGGSTLCVVSDSIDIFVDGERVVCGVVHVCALLHAEEMGAGEKVRRAVFGGVRRVMDGCDQISRTETDEARSPRRGGVREQSYVDD